MSGLDVNARFVLPTLSATLTDLGKKQSNEVLKSRFETLALLLNHIEDDKMWSVMVKEDA